MTMKRWTGAAVAAWVAVLPCGIALAQDRFAKAEVRELSGGANFTEAFVAADGARSTPQERLFGHDLNRSEPAVVELTDRLDGGSALIAGRMRFTSEAGEKESMVRFDFAADDGPLSLGVHYVSPKQVKIIEPMGGRKTIKWENAADRWHRFALRVEGGMATLRLNGEDVYRFEQPGLSLPRRMELTGGAAVADLRARSAPPAPPLQRPLVLDDQANARVTGPGSDPDDAPGGKALADWPPAPAADVDGVRFLLLPGSGLNAVDVAPSMAGWNDPDNVIAHYLDIGGSRARDAVQRFNRVLIPVPGDQYEALHVLAYTPGRDGHTPQFTARLGYYGADGAGQFSDATAAAPPLVGGRAEPDSYTSFTDPRIDPALPEVLSRIPVKLADGSEGSVWHLRLLMTTADLREFDKLHLELTRRPQVHVNVPDPNQFTELPAGPPSDAVVLGATLTLAPLTVQHTSSQGIPVFDDDQPAKFEVTVKNRSESRQAGRVFASPGGPGTGQQHGIKPEHWHVDQPIDLAPGEEKTVTLDLTPPSGRRGWYRTRIGVQPDGGPTNARSTSFAVLAPDTRKATDDSPFGVWCFWNAHTIAPPTEPGVHRDRLAKLIQKGGWKWTYGGVPKPTLDRKEDDVTPRDYRDIQDTYGFNWNMLALPNHRPPFSFRRTGEWDLSDFDEKTIPKLRYYDEAGVEKTYKVLHESRTSNELLRRFSKWLGGDDYEMGDEERAELQLKFDKAVEFATRVKEADPDAKIVLGNDYLQFIGLLLEMGFPAEAFDIIGSEGANFLREPERQPDWHALLGFLAQNRRIQEATGYDKPLWFTEALYHATNPGNLTYHQQAVITVREAMLALMGGAERLAAAGIIIDPSGDYHWSHWGAAGLAHREPDYNPKPSYAMMAWLTQVLDQARPVAPVNTGDPAVFMLHFERPGGERVYPLWTPRGVTRVTLSGKEVPKAFDAFGNPLQLEPDDGGRLRIEASDTPVYLVTPSDLTVESTEPIEQPGDLGKVLVDLAPDAVTYLDRRSDVLEGNWDFPRIKGDFDYEIVELDGGGTGLSVTLNDDDDPRKLFTRYAEFELAEPVELDGKPRYLTARVKGNGGWGRLMFELTDASGRTWTSVGNQHPGAANSGDPHGDSFFAFTGWHTIRFPLPGQYAGDDQTVLWPTNSNWWPTGGPPAKREIDGRYTVDEVGGHTVVYPLTLTKLVVTMRPHILTTEGEVPLSDRTVILDKVGVLGSADSDNPRWEQVLHGEVER